MKVVIGLILCFGLLGVAQVQQSCNCAFPAPSQFVTITGTDIDIWSSGGPTYADLYTVPTGKRLVITRIYVTGSGTANNDYEFWEFDDPDETLVVPHRSLRGTPEPDDNFVITEQLGYVFHAGTVVRMRKNGANINGADVFIMGYLSAH